MIAYYIKKGYNDVDTAHYDCESNEQRLRDNLYAFFRLKYNYYLFFGKNCSGVSRALYDITRRASRHKENRTKKSVHSSSIHAFGIYLVQNEAL